jgi:hypothetical protein
MAGVVFVTRLKDNAAFEVVEECEIPQNSNFRADQLIRLTGVQAHADYPDLLRRIVAWDAVTGHDLFPRCSQSVPRLISQLPLRPDRRRDGTCGLSGGIGYSLV